MVSDEHWRLWMNDQMILIAGSPSFKPVFLQASGHGLLRADFCAAFEPVFSQKTIVDPWTGTPPPAGEAVVGSNGHGPSPTRSLVTPDGPAVSTWARGWGLRTE